MLYSSGTFCREKMKRERGTEVDQWAAVQLLVKCHTHMHTVVPGSDSEESDSDVSDAAPLDSEVEREQEKTYDR